MKITIEQAANGYIFTMDDGAVMYAVSRLVFTDFEDMLAEVRRLMEVKK